MKVLIFFYLICTVFAKDCNESNKYPIKQITITVITTPTAKTTTAKTTTAKTTTAKSTTAKSTTAKTTTVKTTTAKSTTAKTTTATATAKTTTATAQTTTVLPTNGNEEIQIMSGNRATLTYFTDTTTQCYGENIPSGNGIAINPLLLGFTEQDWSNMYSGAPASDIPWCGRILRVIVNGNKFIGRIIDTCDPVGNTFPDPNTGQPIGGKCDYMNVIDLYGENGRNFLMSTVGDDFYQGQLEWEII